ncbi:MAG: hypothetical protein H7A01_03800 [Hahellaceae bacterium]|nr:hypothetical protein [Hahellaceae bacterium]MCP5212229.1 hypothetical protein [Hahellaceae bacterium]
MNIKSLRRIICRNKDNGVFFGSVSENEFFRVEGKQPNHIAIEKALIDIGGGSWEGFQFKETAIKLAGWVEGSDKAYSTNPYLAADTFNKIQLILLGTTSRSGILEELKVRK